jgi:hypothetical protein
MGALTKAFAVVSATAAIVQFSETDLFARGAHETCSQLDAMPRNDGRGAGGARPVKPGEIATLIQVFKEFEELRSR